MIASWMNRPDHNVAQTPADAPSPASVPAEPKTTLDYSSLPSRRTHANAVKNAWPITFMFWAGALSAGCSLLLLHDLITTTAAGLDFVQFLVAVGQSMLVASFSSGMFALSINGKIFHSHRELIRRPFTIAFVLGASVPALIGVCLLTSAISNFPPLQLLLLLLLFALATIYPMMTALWLGDRVE